MDHGRVHRQSGEDLLVGSAELVDGRAYQPVDGLGAVAGYAGSDLNVDSGGSYLVAIIEIGGAFVEVVTKADPDATVEQLRPIADELLPEVESELR